MGTKPKPNLKCGGNINITPTSTFPQQRQQNKTAKPKLEILNVGSRDTVAKFDTKTDT